MFDDLYSEYNFLRMLQELKSARLSILEGRVVLVLEYQALGTIGLHVRVRVSSSICGAGHDQGFPVRAFLLVLILILTKPKKHVLSIYLVYTKYILTTYSRK